MTSFHQVGTQTTLEPIGNPRTGTLPRGVLSPTAYWRFARTKFANLCVKQLS